jgi:GT2 family glycosyltransferase
MTNSKKYPLVSIVSVNWNQAELTRVMLKSLELASYPNLDVWVVDNGSTKGNLKSLKEDFPRVNFIISPENLGFAGGNNLALERVKGDYVLLLNNDTEVDPHFLQPMVELMEKNKEIGIVSPKIFFYDHPEILQYAGTTLIHPITNRGKKFGYGEKDNGKYDNITETGFPNGACMLIRKEAMDKVGLMYENYFLYYEEHDFTHKVREAGYKIYFQPFSRIFHKVSATTGKASPLKAYYLHRNRQVFNRRNFHGFTFLLSSLYYFLIATPKAIAKHAIDQDWKLVRSILRATFWHGKNMHLPQKRLSAGIVPEVI